MPKPFTVFLEETSDLDDHGQTATLSRIITKELEPRLLFRQMFRQDRFLVGRGGNTRRYPKRSAVSAAAFGEGVDVPQISPDFQRSFVEVEVTKYGARDELTGEVIDDADFAIISDVREGLVDAMARFHDTKALWALTNAVNVAASVITPLIANDGFADSQKSEVAAGDNTFAFEASLSKERHVLRVNSVTHSTEGLLVEGVDYRIDYYDGIIQIPDGLAGAAANGLGGTTADSSNYAGGETLTIDYDYVDEVPGANEADFSLANYHDVIAAGTMSWKDIIRGRALVKSRNGAADTLITDDTLNVDLLEDDKFLSADVLAVETVREGMIGRAAGMGVWETTQMFPGVAIILKSGDVGWEVIKEDLATRIEIITKRINDRYVMFEERNAFAIVRPELITIVLNGGDAAVAATA